jgi:putative chitinase
MTEDEQIDLLLAELDKQSVTDNTLRAGIAAIAMGESGFQMNAETGYANTANSRIRAVFGHRVYTLSEAQLSLLKSNPATFFNFVYGGDWGALNLGNTQPGDGFRFRGRGLFQLTGRANYDRYGKMIGVDLLTDPEAANNPQTACAIAVAYMRDRYKGGGWEEMKAAVGVNISDIDDTKNRLFAEYEASGEFDAEDTPAAPAA